MCVSVYVLCVRCMLCVVVWWCVCVCVCVCICVYVCVCSYMCTCVYAYVMLNLGWLYKVYMLYVCINGCAYTYSTHAHNKHKSTPQNTHTHKQHNAHSHTTQHTTHTQPNTHTQHIHKHQTGELVKQTTEPTTAAQKVCLRCCCVPHTPLSNHTYTHTHTHIYTFVYI